MTLGELRGKEPPPSLSNWNAASVSLLWHEGYWDGPMSGLLAYEGQEYWFDMIQENDDGDATQWFRRYAIVRLSREQLDYEHMVHEDFRRYVGTHCDYVQNRRNHEGIKPQSQWHLFYDKHQEDCHIQRFDQAEVVAWFER